MSRARFVSTASALSLAACVLAVGCGGGYPEPASPTVEEEDPQQPEPATGGPEGEPPAGGDDDLDDPRPKGDPTDDIDDPADQKHDDESLRTTPPRASKTAAAAPRSWVCAPKT